MEKIQKIVRYIWVLFNCVMLTSCSTLRLGAKAQKRTQKQIREAIQTNNYQKLMVALESAPRSVERNITLAKSASDFGINRWKSDQESNKNAEVGLEELSRGYDFFLREVHENIRRGIANRDSEMVLSGLIALSWLISSTGEGRSGAFDLRTAVGGLLDNNLEKFRSKNVDELAYRQLEEDYNQLMEAGKEYFIALGGKDTKLNQLVMHRSQTASILPVVLSAAAVASLTAGIFYLGLLGVWEDRLLRSILLLDKAIRHLCQSEDASIVSKALRSIKEDTYSSSYNSAVRMYCEESQEGRDLFKEVFVERDPDPGYPNCTVRLFPDLCPSREWFCRAIKHAKSCLDKREMNW